MPTVRANANRGGVWQYTYPSVWIGNATGQNVPSAGASPGPYYLAVFDFNWPSIPAGAVITGAVLNVFVSGGAPALNGSSEPTDMGLGAITSHWNPGQAQWPASTGLGWLPSGSAQNGQWLTVDVTSLAQAQYAGSPRYGVIWGFTALKNGSLYVHGYDQANKPFVDLTYTMAPTAPVLTSPNGGESINTLHTITWNPATDQETAQNALRYHIQLSTDNKQTWSDILALTAPGATSYEHNFAGAPESSVCFVRIRAYDGGAYGPWDDSDGAFMIAHNVAPLAPTNLAPAAGAVDRSVTQRLSWVHQDAGDQSKFDLRWSSNGGADWNMVTVATPNQYWDAAPGTLPAGQIVWQVRTYDQENLVGPYSAQASFVAGDTPSMPVISYPEDGGTVPISRPTVQWSSSGQVGYQVLLTTAGGETVWDSGDVTSENKAQTIGTDLDNGTVRIVKVRIRSASGLWSSWDTAEFTVSYTPAAAPVLTAIPLGTQGKIRTAIVNPMPTPPEPAAVHNDLYRRQIGTEVWVRLAAEMAPGVAFDDYTAASGVAYEYQVRALAENGTAIYSAIINATLALTGLWLHDVLDPGGTILHITRNTGRAPFWKADVTMLQLEGRRLPMAVFGENEEEGGRWEGLLRDSEGTPAALEALARRTAILCARDGSGRRLFGVMAEWAPKPQPGGVQTVTIAIDAVDYSEGV